MSWHGWTVDPSLIYVLAAAALYKIGGRGFTGQDRSPRRELCFVAGLLTIALALNSPIDGYADQLFWVHMFQHVLLLTVAPPLILFGRPWPRMWRALPIGLRTSVGRTLSRSRWTAPIRGLAHPIPSFIVFNATIIAWHIPAAYDLTLRNGTVHAIEHAMFFFTGLLFWARVIDPGPLRSLRLAWPARIAYVIGTMVISWIIAITLVLVPEPIYSFYAHLAHRPGGISALTDQQIAAGIMWVPGSISYTIAMMAGVYRWLEPDTRPSRRSTALST